MDINQRLTEELNVDSDNGNACGSRRPVSPISSKAPHTCDNREGERT